MPSRTSANPASSPLATIAKTSPSRRAQSCAASDRKEKLAKPAGQRQHSANPRPLPAWHEVGQQGKIGPVSESQGSGHD